MDELRAIRYFVKVVELGSFSRAAVAFNVPPSSLSRRISDLESRLQAQLLTRSTRVVRVTEVGQAYYQRVRPILDQLAQSGEMVRSYQTKPQGQLHISSTVGFGKQVLLPILDRFVVQYPDIVLDISLSDELSRFPRDEIDLAVRAGFVPDARVVAKKLIDNEFVLVAAPHFIRENPLPDSPLALTQFPAFHFKTPKGPLPWLWSDGKQWQRVTGLTKGSSNHGDWLIQQALQGRGLSMLPRWAVATHLREGSLIEIRFSSPIQVSQNPDLGIYLLYQKHKYAMPKVKAAVDFVCEQIAELSLT